MRKLIIILTAFLLIGLCGCNGTDNSPADYPKEPEVTQSQEQHFSRNGMHFVLPLDFTDFTDSPLGKGYTFLYANNDWGLIGLHDPKSSENFQDMTDFITSYAEQAGCEATQKDGFWTFTCSDDTKNETETNVYVFYESKDSYWIVKAYCREDTYETYREAMWKAATSATLD